MALSHTLASLLRGLGRRGVAVAAVVCLLAAAGFVALRDGEDPRTVTAHFPRAVSIFVGADVRVLGVTVGRVTAVLVEGATDLLRLTVGTGTGISSLLGATAIDLRLVAIVIVFKKFRKMERRQRLKNLWELLFPMSITVARKVFH